MKKLIVANWKCNPTTIQEAKRLFRAVAKSVKREKGVEVVICPPFVYLTRIKNKELRIKLGAQDCFWEQEGAYTGEISPAMLKDLGCEYVIVGHSERRRYLGETDAMINKKIKAVLAAKMRPILCVGETVEERDGGLTRKVLQKQLTTGLQGIQKPALKKIIIAYEPVWAIGTGNACSLEEARKALEFIRKTLRTLGDVKIARSLSILYGGSVNSLNAGGYIKEADFLGLLVGGASLDAEEFTKITKCAIEQ